MIWSQSSTYCVITPLNQKFHSAVGPGRIYKKGTTKIFFEIELHRPLYNFISIIVGDTVSSKGATDIDNQIFDQKRHIWSLLSERVTNA